MDRTLYNLEALKMRFRREFLWITSDQAAAFDDVFRFPFRNINIIRNGVHHYLIEWGKLTDNETHGLNVPYDDMFDIWRHGGEDIERILYWHASISNELSSKGSTSDWHDVFWRWAKRPKHMSSYMAQDRFRDFMELVHKDYTIPLKKFDRYAEGIDEFWISNSSNRSDWDNFLWKHFFEEVYIAPVDYFSLTHGNLLLRQFWKKHRSFLSTEEKQALYSDFVLELQLMHGTDEAFDWNWVVPIDDAIDIDSLPDFDNYKRDW